MVERTVLYDVYTWHTPIEGRTDGRTEYHVARMGDKIQVSAEEAARGESFTPPALGTPGEAAAALQASVEPPTWSDEQLDSASVPETIAYLGQHPSEAERVLGAEKSREARSLKVRKGVVDAAERIIPERDAALEDAADAAERDAELEDELAVARAAGSPSVPGNAPAIPR